MKIRVIITLKNGVLDPQGTAVSHALVSMNYPEMKSIRQGKVIDIDLGQNIYNEDMMHEICRKLLVNTVIEDYKITILEE